MSEQRFFSYDPEDGRVKFHDTAEEAKAAAVKAFDYYQDDAAEGWDEAVDDVCWGEVKGRVSITKRIERPPSAELTDGYDKDGNRWDNEFDALDALEFRSLEDVKP